MHPDFLLLDKDQNPVTISGKPVSTKNTCGGCHDTDYIKKYSSHARKRLENLPHSPTTDGELNCFLCHTPTPNDKARVEAIQQGNLQWAITATLLGTGLIEQEGEAYRWNQEAFDSGHFFKNRKLAVQSPTSRNCAVCHGVVQQDAHSSVKLTQYKEFWRTDTTGQIISPYAIADSSINLTGKSELERPWDVHAERMVGCTGCHFSLNHPGFFQVYPRIRPAHLIFDGRKISIGDYLKQPDHRLASGKLNRCRVCHDVKAAHNWLPYRTRHMKALSCETCHIPHLYAPAKRQIDATVLTSTGEPRAEYRGVEDQVIDSTTAVQGYKPAWLRSDQKQELAFFPYNLITSWSWVAGQSGHPVDMSILKKAYFDQKGYHAEITAVFDQNKDGKLDNRELRLDSDIKQATVRKRLQALGVKDPKIQGEILPFKIHHNVIGNQWAISDCAYCHSQDSKITKPTLLASYMPGNVMPTFSKDQGIELEGNIQLNGQGELVYDPHPVAKGLYILGRYRAGWADWTGIIFALAVLVGIAGHAGLRIYAQSKIQVDSHGEFKRIFIYSLYARLWHWTQAIVIILLLFTGLEIHMPDSFPLFGFPNSIFIHNVLGVAMLVNAFLAAFYHFATGEIRQYLPEPHGFINQAILQMKYYLYGIFHGKPHPFEKVPEKKLNPLQQITYVIILNILLPIQVVTGVLIWTSGHWPDLTAGFATLHFLAALHSLAAWLFGVFLIVHIYLSTTGHQPLTYLKAIISGWEEVEVIKGEKKHV